MKKFSLWRALLGTLLVLSLFLQPFSALQLHAEDEGYHIYINVPANVVTVYYNGTPVRAMITSTGDVTPADGTYYIPQKFRWGYLCGDVYGQYCTRIVKGILFHSVPYTDYGDCGSLKHGQYDLLGTKASMGCMRLTVADAKWIYENIPMGTAVTFYSDTETPSPLGMPFSARTSSFSEELAGWDPTDPASDNPWNKYLGDTFDADYYLSNNPDLSEIACWTDDSLRLHWLTKGIAEDRSASADFDLRSFKRKNIDLLSRIGDDNYDIVAFHNQTKARGEKMLQAHSGK